MKKLLLASTAALISTAGFAADIAHGAKPVVVTATAAPSSWTGFYAGADVGYGWSGDQLVGNGHATGLDPSLTSAGVVLGGHAGYNYQIGSAFVVGAIADISWSDINGSGSVISGLDSESSRLNWFGTVRGRAGYLITPKLLAYGTAGGAFGGASASANANACGGPCIPVSLSGTNFGWTAGAGLEYSVTSAWSVTAEWLHIDLGSISGSTGPTNCIFGKQCGFTEKVVDDVYRVGASYHF